MKKNRKFLSLFLCFTIAVGFSACSKSNGSDSGKGENGLKYQNIYKQTEEYTHKTNDKIFKASYGYNLSNEQGADNFYFEALTDGSYKKMIKNGDCWLLNNASIDKENMTAVTSSSPTRCFSAPSSGEAFIYCNVKLLSDKPILFKVFHNEKEIYSEQVKDKAGVYFGQKLQLQKKDTVRFLVVGEGMVSCNPTVDYALEEEELLHTTVDGFYGDVHPFYDQDSGKLYMYYLSTGNQKKEFHQQFESMATVSEDFVHFKDQPIGVSKTTPPEQDLYFALGVYKDKKGKYRSSYGKRNYAGASVSSDLLTWAQGATPYVDEKDGLLKYTYRTYFGNGVTSGRDPDVYYDKDSDKYYCVVINYYSDSVDKGEKGLALYEANGEGKFSSTYKKILDFTGKGDPECPQLKKIGARWYVFYSEYGTGTAGNVGKFNYRIGDEDKSPLEVDWQSKTEYSLDGGDLHAAQLCSVGEKYYLFGWINYRPSINVWGGYLNMAREVYAKEDGTLRSRCDEYYTALLNKGKISEFDNENVSLDKLIYEDGKFVCSGEGSGSLSGEYYRNLIYADFEPGNTFDSGYLTINSGNAVYYVGMKKSGGSNYLVITANLHSPLSGVSIKTDILDGQTYKLKVVVDGAFIEAFVNDEYSLTAHTLLSGNVRYGMQMKGEVSASNMGVYKLSCLQNIFD